MSQGKGKRIIFKSNELSFSAPPEPWQERRALIVDPLLGFDTKALDLKIGDLPPGGHNVKHRETHEHIMYFLSGRGYLILDEERYEWEAGDAIFIPSWTWHQWHNSDIEKPARYLMITNTPMVDNLGLNRKWQQGEELLG